MPRTLLTAVVVGALSLTAVGCDLDIAEPQPLYAVLDHTGSSVGGSTKLCRDHLVELAKRRYGSFPGDPGVVRADVFDKTTVTSPVFPVRVTFEVEAAKQSSVKRSEEDLAGDLADLGAKLDRLIEDAGPAAGGTDVVTMLASLGAAARNAGGKVIWLCTDLRDRRLPNRFGIADVDRLVEEVRANGAMPDLGGLEVMIDTVTIKGRPMLSSRELAALEHLAETLVSASGGALIAYGPG